jgi:hypothetical protein
MRPLDIRSAILAKHAQHVVLTHFPNRAVFDGGRVRFRRKLDEACDCGGRSVR